MRAGFELNHSNPHLCYVFMMSLKYEIFSKHLIFFRKKVSRPKVVCQEFAKKLKAVNYPGKEIVI